MCEELGAEVQVDQTDSIQDLSATQTSDVSIEPIGNDFMTDDVSVPISDNPRIVHDKSALAGDSLEQCHSTQQYAETQDALATENVPSDSQYASIEEFATEIQSMSHLESSIVEKLKKEVSAIDKNAVNGQELKANCNGCSGTCHGSCSGSCSGSCDASKTGRSCYYK